MGIDITDFEKAYDATKNFQSHMPGWARHYMDERKEISKSLQSCSNSVLYLQSQVAPNSIFV